MRIVVLGDWRRPGYQTAVLSKIAAQVYSIERIGDLARGASGSELIYNATVKCFDGTLVGGKRATTRFWLLPVVQQCRSH